MKHLILRSVILAAATILLSASAFAQRTAMHFTVPFAFSSGERDFVAGAYIVRWDPIQNFMQLEREGGETLFLPPGIIGNTPALTARGKLVFHQYGSSYFLHGVERPGAMKCEWPPSKAERQAAKSQGAVEVALTVR